MKKRVYRADLSGVMNVPGSKSHTIRACLFAALAEGESKIKNPLPSEDCLSALAAIQQFGALVEEKENLWSVKGCISLLRLLLLWTGIRFSPGILQ